MVGIESNTMEKAFQEKKESGTATSIAATVRKKTRSGVYITNPNTPYPQYKEPQCLALETHFLQQASTSKIYHSIQISSYQLGARYSNT